MRDNEEGVRVVKWSPQGKLQGSDSLAAIKAVEPASGRWRFGLRNEAGSTVDAGTPMQKSRRCFSASDPTPSAATY